MKTETEKREIIAKKLKPERVNELEVAMREDFGLNAPASVDLIDHVRALELELEHAQELQQQYQIEAQRDAQTARTAKARCETMAKAYSGAVTTSKEVGYFASFALQGILASPIYAQEGASFPNFKEAAELAMNYGKAMAKEIQRSLPVIPEPEDGMTPASVGGA